MESAADFGTGLRAHLGLEQAELDLIAVPEAAPEEIAALAAELPDEAVVTPDGATLDALVGFETELIERERELSRREAGLSARAGALLATAQALYDDVLAGRLAPNNDELARLRRRKSGAA